MTPRRVKPTPVMSSYRPRKKVTEPKLSDWNSFIWGFLLGITPLLIDIFLNHTSYGN